VASDDRRAAAHGGPSDALDALGIDYARVLDFSVSINAYGPSPEMLEAIARADVTRYPDPSAAPARRALGAWLDVAPGSIALGNGAAELLWTAARALLRAGDAALIVEPTFGEFRAACGAIGAVVHAWRASLEDGFAIDLDAIGSAAAACHARAIYLCAPNSPTGAAVDAADIARWARSLDAALVLDQSFLSLSERFADRARRMPDNVVIVRSLTKDHALPGLRVGYTIAARELAARLEQQRPAWAASAHAQRAAIAATQLDAFVARSRDALRSDREALSAALVRAGLRAVDSSANFMLVEVPDAARVQAALLRDARILVRDCSSFGLPNIIRVAARPAPDRQQLVAALARAVPRPI
jgi:histidinol-phosphate/aromatic aminotransferase/cobyric acid decarboxylase-like protein